MEYVPVCPEVECGLGVPRETMRLVGDPRTVKEDFGSDHWNVLLDLDGDGYKEYWIDLDGGWTQKDENNEYYDRVQILYDNNNRQDIPDPDATGVRVDEFRAYNGNETCTSTPCAAGQNCSFTRVREATDGTGDYWIDLQVPMTAFKDSEGKCQEKKNVGLNKFLSVHGCLIAYQSQIDKFK